MGVNDAHAPPSQAVVEAVAEADGTDPETLTPPLNDVVDPDALDRLFDDRTEDSPRDSGHLTFLYHGYMVVVYSTGDVEVQE
ncbi:HalOD1 output domain-containing protein [Haloarculaceae archaeon H-GB2-1]|nr:hypothetical protein [Haloarculaceae archaeon H-GB1-1]MEA5386664.1 HalOD1 output domain-containing protein [Haloarculaceae archaeon H-GB11]MEA5408186.1 HalOD1 output domain-containing protein [Haloarculaceae archaeon H-GB2-1]